MLELINAPASVRSRLGSATRLPERRALVPLATFAVTQAVAFLAFLSASGGAHGELMDRWDGAAYRWIAREGYVTEASGHTDAPAFEGLWAFFPLYPMIVRGVMWVTPLGWDVAAPVVSLAAGAAAVVLLHRLLARHIGSRHATVAVVLLCAWMAAPVMQMSYTESLALLLLAVSFHLLERRRYGALFGALVLLALCRNVVVAFAVVLAAHVVVLWRQRAPRSDLWRAAAVLAACPILFLLWPAFAWVTSGRPAAYFDSMAAWGGPDVPRSWLFAAVGLGAVGWLALVAGIVAAIWTAVRFIPGPVELRTWAAAYPLYILAGTYMSGSIVRYLLLNFPAALLWVPLADRGRAGRVVLAAVAVSGVVLSVMWVHLFVDGSGGPIP